MEKKCVLLAAAIALAGCHGGSNEPGPDITGKWVGNPDHQLGATSIDEQIEFKPDGTAHKTVDFSVENRIAHIDGDYTYTLRNNILSLHPTGVHQTGEDISDPTNSSADETDNIYWNGSDKFSEPKMNYNMIFKRVKDQS